MKALLSVDVEDWFQVENLKQAIKRDSWEGNISRVEGNINLILDLLSQKNTKATFFILGWIAERHPKLIKDIYKEGHEIACHGYEHELISNLSKDKFKHDVLLAKNILEDLIGDKVIGYRAPNFSITDWAIDVLVSLGFKYDSSLFPIVGHSRYGKLKKVNIPNNSVFQMRDGFYQVMLSYIKLAGFRVPWSGGLYFRLIPYSLFKMGIKKVAQQKGTYVFYIHPWEFDPEQPKIENIKLNYKLRHYSNLKGTENKFKRLLSDFDFCRIKDIILPLS
jgi:polysaccharide deacetylase family protein (PEP-CTERM system associated)